jgi:hypothetical protein
MIKQNDNQILNKLQDKIEFIIENEKMKSLILNLNKEDNKQTILKT